MADVNDGGDGRTIRVALLGGFRVSTGIGLIPLPGDAQRLIAFLALQQRPPLRDHAAGVLWYDCSQDRANGNLRTALWRTRSAVAGLITTPEPHHLGISPDAAIDVRDLLDDVYQIISDSSSFVMGGFDVASFAEELLPGWYDDWVVVEREHLRQLRLHALEELSIELLASGRLAEALDVALTAVDLDPLRESANRCVIRVHLAEGNRSEALLHLKRYCELLQKELGIKPSDRLASLLGPGVPDLW